MIQFFVDRDLFRNVNHAIWFFCTIGIFSAVLLQKIFPQHLWLILLIGFAAHLSPIINAVAVAVRKEESDLYTKDCIIYNIVMLAAYIALYLFLT